MHSRLAAIALLVVFVCACGPALPGCKKAPPPGPAIPEDLDALEPQLRDYMEPFIDRVRGKPGDAAAHAELGLVYEANELWPSAVVAFQNAVELAPNQALCQYHLAVALARTGQDEAALDLLRRISRAHPSLAPAWHRLGHRLLDDGEVNEASAAFQRVINLLPKAPAGYIGLGAAKKQAGAHEEAAGLLERAIEMDSSDQMAHFLLGGSYMRLGRKEEAKRELALGVNGQVRYLPDEWTPRVRRYAQTATAQLNRARHLYAVGDAVGAARILESTVARHPKNVDALNNLAIAYVSMDRAKDALELLLRAERADRTDSFTYANLALCEIELQNLDGALAYADRSVELAPQSADAHLTRGRVLLMLRHAPDAAMAFSESVKIDPQSMPARIALANTYFGMKDFAAAKVHYAAVLELAPEMISALVRYCESCIHTGAREAAAVALTRLARHGENDVEIRETVAALRIRMED
ncbi:MAG: tetratricopeptide repeat protein [Planctomycetes bacterium]|nr:tetratricopeptide repeat protein [Planctomycetota bacterium]